MGPRVAILSVTLVVLLQSIASAQEPGAYVGGTGAVHVQPHGDSDPLGGTTWSGSVLLGAHVSPGVALECETYFSGAFSNDYSYRPGPSSVVDVTARRRDTFVAFQLRTRVAPSFEPVVGASYVLEQVSRHAAFANGGSTYFDDAETRHGFAVVGGLDAPVSVGPRFSIVPSFRVFVTTSRSAEAFDPLGADTQTGSVAVRFGIGGRVVF